MPVRKAKCVYCNKVTPRNSEGQCSYCQRVKASQVRPISQHRFDRSPTVSCQKHGPHFIASWGYNDISCLECTESEWKIHKYTPCNPCKELPQETKFTEKASCLYCYVCRQEFRKQQRITKAELAAADRMIKADVTDALDFGTR